MLSAARKFLHPLWNSDLTSQLRPEEVLRFFFANMLDALQSTDQEQKKNNQNIVISFEKQSRAIQFSINNYSAILLNPTSDFSERTANNGHIVAGMSLLKESIEHLKKLQAKQSTAIFIIPLAECYPDLFHQNGRKHWTFLMIQDKACYFFDPKGQSVYSIEKIKTQLTSEDYQWKAYYVGWQPLEDDTHCGYFTGRLIGKTLLSLYQNKNLEEPSIPDFFGEKESVAQVKAEHEASLSKHIELDNQLKKFFRMETETEVELKEFEEEEEEGNDGQKQLLNSTDLTQSGELVPDFNSPDEQLKRDYESIRGAILHPGEDPFSGEILKEAYALLYTGNFYYKKNKQWHPWNITPISAALCHGSKVIIQLEGDVDEEKFNEWFFPKEKHEQEDYKRTTATHGISSIQEQTSEEKRIGKRVKEDKVTHPHAAIRAGRKWIAKTLPLASQLAPQGTHLGVNLALNGEGNTSNFTEHKVKNNGQHGHLYIHEIPVREEPPRPAGRLLNIENSAPGEKDQQWGGHNFTAHRSSLTATHGTYFGKESFSDPRWQEREGVPDEYRDCMFVLVTKNTFELAQAFVKNESLSGDLEWLNRPCLIEKEKEQLLQPDSTEPRRLELEQLQKKLQEEKKASEKAQYDWKKILEKNNELRATIVKKDSTIIFQANEIKHYKETIQSQDNKIKRPNDHIGGEFKKYSSYANSCFGLFGVTAGSSTTLITLMCTGSLATTAVIIVGIAGAVLVNAAFVALAVGVYYQHQAEQPTALLEEKLRTRITI